MSPAQRRQRAAPVTTRKAPLKAVPAIPPAPLANRVVEIAVEHMAPEHLQCRDFGHSWRPFSATWNERFRYYEAQLKCQRCKAIRTRYIGPHGELAGNKYEYEDGYLLPGVGRLTSADRDRVRLASILRQLPRTVEGDG